MSSLISGGAYLNNYHAVAHPSQPNYVALIAGDTMGVTSDSNVNLSGQHLGDLIEAKGLTWKIYLEDYPGNCFTGATSALYARKHNPFISFTNIQSNLTRCNAHLVPSAQLALDIAANQLPNYAMYVPNLNDDGHNTDVQTADTWLSSAFSANLKNPNFINNNLFVVTFDENDASNDIDNNLIYTVFSGPMVKTGFTSNVQYTHYSLVNLIESVFSLGNMGRNDVTATPITDPFNK